MDGYVCAFILSEQRSVREGRRPSWLSAFWVVTFLPKDTQEAMAGLSSLGAGRIVDPEDMNSRLEFRDLRLGRWRPNTIGHARLLS